MTVTATAPTTADYLSITTVSQSYSGHDYSFWNQYTTQTGAAVNVDSTTNKITPGYSYRIAGTITKTETAYYSGDGNVASEIDAKLPNGTYTVTLTVSNILGGSGTASRSVTVSVTDLTNNTVQNTNVITADTTYYDVAPAGTHTGSTTSGISHTANSYVSQPSLTVTAGSDRYTKTFTVTRGTYGAVVDVEDDRAVSGFMLYPNYLNGDGEYFRTTSKVYAYPGGGAYTPRIVVQCYDLGSAYMAGTTIYIESVISGEITDCNITAGTAGTSYRYEIAPANTYTGVTVSGNGNVVESYVSAPTLTMTKGDTLYKRLFTATRGKYGALVFVSEDTGNIESGLAIYPSYPDVMYVTNALTYEYGGGTYTAYAYAYSADLTPAHSAAQTVYIEQIIKGSVTDSNIYSSAYKYEIAPPNTYTGVATADNSNTANSYVSAPTFSVSTGTSALERVFTVSRGKYGAVIAVESSAIISGYRVRPDTSSSVWLYCDENNTARYQYALNGAYNAVAFAYADGAGVANSSSQTVDINVPAPTINSIVVNGGESRVTIYNPVSLSATITPTLGTNTYQWYYSTDNGSTWNIISGATSLTGSSHIPNTEGTYKYKLIVTNSYGGTSNAVSNPITVAWYLKPTVTISCSPTFGYVSSSTTGTELTAGLTATISDPDSIVTGLQWYVRNGDGNWQLISGATGSSAAYRFTAYGDGFYYFKLQATTNYFGTVESNVVSFETILKESGRPLATQTLTVPDGAGANSILANINFNGDISNAVPILQSGIDVYKVSLGSALFWILIFGIPALLIFFATGSAKIPAIIGIGLSGFIMVMFPEAWQTTILVLIGVVVTTGILWLFVRRGE